MANVEAIIKEGIRAYKAKKKDEARVLFEKATELDQNNEQAWLWLSAVVDTEEDQRVCLENVLFLNPDNKNAQKGLAVLDAKAASAPPAPESTPPTATSSASSVFTGEDVPEEVYDDWISNMNLGGSKTSTGTLDTSPFSATTFTDEDVFNDDPFSGPVPAVFDDDDDVFDDDPFSADQTPDALRDTSGPFAVGSDDVDDDDLFGAPVPAQRQSPVSPVSAPSPRRQRSSGYQEGAIFVDDDAYASGSNMDDDPDEYFRSIPASIKPTRLPGTDEPLPILLILGVVVLLALNAGAIALLIDRLAG